MDEVEFTISGQRHTLARDAVTKAMKRQSPGRIQTWSVDIEGVNFPVKQVLAQSLGIPTTEFISTRAQEILSKLGFQVSNIEVGAVGSSNLPGNFRLEALQLAVVFMSSRADASTEQVLDAASAFEQWIRTA